MPFKKSGKSGYKGPSGDRYTKKRVKAYYVKKKKTPRKKK